MSDVNSPLEDPDPNPSESAPLFGANDIPSATLVGSNDDNQHTHYVTLDETHLRPHRRRKGLPIVLFVLTCFSTFWAGALGWPLEFRFDLGYLVQSCFNNAGRGFAYMICVLAILFAHEMGHFIATIIHRVPASLPFFIPFPFNPLGTMGAVIAMDGRRGNRRQVFDIGIAGPLAGLVFAIPILIYGVATLDVSKTYTGGYRCDSPILVDFLVHWLHSDTSQYTGSIAKTQLNPYFMAGWVGLLITGLNMMPVSQLDGGHVIYSLFGRKRALRIARGFVFVAIFSIVVFDAFIWGIMLMLVVFIGTDHPPTRDDTIPLGRARTLIGTASLAIPLLCFPPYLFLF